MGYEQLNGLRGNSKTCGRNYRKICHYSSLQFPITQTVRSCACTLVRTDILRHLVAVAQSSRNIEIFTRIIILNGIDGS